MDQVEALLKVAQTQAPAQAVVTLEKALALSPQHELASTMLGIQYFRLKRWSDAVRLLSRDGAGKTFAARARIALAEQFDPPDRQFLEEAYRLLQEVITATPSDGQAWLGLARIHWLLQDADRALECVGKSVNADGRLDFDDFEALIFGCQILVETRRFGSLRPALERLEGLSQEGQARRQIAQAISKVCTGLARAGELATALEVAPFFERIAPGEPELSQVARTVRRLAGLSEDKARLAASEKLAHQVLDLQIRLDQAALAETEDRQAAQELIHLSQELPKEKLEALGRALRHCKSLSEVDHPFFKLVLAPRAPLGPPPVLESLVAPPPSLEGLSLAQLRQALNDGFPGAAAALTAAAEGILAGQPDLVALGEVSSALSAALATAPDKESVARLLSAAWKRGMSCLQADPRPAWLEVVDRLNAGAVAGQLALGRISDDRLVSAAELLHLRGARPASWKVGQAGLADLLEKLSTPATREAAVTELVQVSPAELPVLSRPLSALLGSPEAEVRLAAARVLTGLRRYAAPAQAALTAALGDSSPEVRQAAAQALAAMGPAAGGAVPALRRMGDEPAALAALQALTS